MQRYLGLALAASFAGAISLREPAGSAKVVQHDIRRVQGQELVARNRFRKRDTVSLSLENEQVLYLADVSIGTPPQAVRLQIDTGSSDLWVNTPSSAYCSASPSPCDRTYTANDSSTYVYLNSDFDIVYLDNGTISGDYATDTVSLGDVTIPKQEFAIGYTSDNPEGILGIGYIGNEYAANDGKEYPNVPQQMADLGIINTNAFSLWLNDLSASTGSILFGGVDSAKYQGSLSTFPVIQNNGAYLQFLVSMTGVGANGTEGTFSSSALKANLDAGTSLTYLPQAIAQSVFDAVGAQYDDSVGAAYVDCSMANNVTTLDFSFSDLTIKVDMSEMVIVAVESSSGNTCILGVTIAGEPSTSNPADAILGDTFLRSAYVVYDLTNNEISMAPTNFNASDSNIMEIGSSAGTSSTSSSSVASSTTSIASSTSSAVSTTSSVASSTSSAVLSTSSAASSTSSAVVTSSSSTVPTSSAFASSSTTISSMSNNVMSSSSISSSSSTTISSSSSSSMASNSTSMVMPTANNSTSITMPTAGNGTFPMSTGSSNMTGIATSTGCGSMPTALPTGAVYCGALGATFRV